MDDLISRQAAIDSVRAGVLSTATLYGRTEEGETARKEIERTIKALPSVNPQASKEDIHREREQAYMKGYEDASKRYRTEPCDDAISRQEVLEGLARIAKAKAKSDVQKSLMGRVLFFTEHLPPVTPQQKSGEWIEDAKTYYEELNKRCLGVDEYTPYFTDDIACSECLAKYSTIDNETEFFKYCPNCGAKMEVEE